MKEEIESLHKNKTWELVTKPIGVKLVGFKQIYKINEGIPGVEGTRYKVRLVVKGFTQREDINYNEIFSPFVKHSYIRLLLSFTAFKDMYLESLDVKIAFLHEKLDQKIYMQPPESFIDESNSKQVYLLKKS